MQRTSAIEIFAVLTINVRVSLNLFYFNNLFLGRMMANFDINEFTIAPEKSCKIGRCNHIRRRLAPVRYVTTQEKILKNSPVPGRLSNSSLMCKSVKSYDVSFICDHSISNIQGGYTNVIVTSPHVYMK